MKILTDAQAAYLAGFFDSKGSVSITKSQGASNRTPSYVLRIIFSQSGDKGLRTLQSFMEMTGLGTINHYISKSYGNRQHEWRIVSHEAAECMQVMLPHLLVKKEQVLVALQFAEVVNLYRHKGRGYVVPSDVVELKEHWWKKMQEAKKSLINDDCEERIRVVDELATT